MLTPKQLEEYPKRLVEIYSEVENDIIVAMAKRISQMDFIPSAEWQYKKLIEMREVHEVILKKLSEASGIRVHEIEKMMKDAGVKAVKTDLAIYRKAGITELPLGANESLQGILKQGIDSTNGLFENLTQTTAENATMQYINMLDKSWLQINSGAFSPNEVIKTAIKELTNKGLATVKYANNHTDYLDVSVRRATLTGINQTALKMQEQLADEMETDLVEVTAHAGARTGKGIANHSEWQGKVYSRSGKSTKYPSLVEKTGYGTGPGLGGYNCRHSMFPFIEGDSEPAYTQNQLDALNAPKYKYNGEKLTEYEATQKQREIERNIRKYKRESIAMKAAGLQTETLYAESVLKHWQEEQIEFIKQTKLKRQYDRENVEGYK